MIQSDVIEGLLKKARQRADALRRLPVSTYRLQLHAHFSFRDAARIIPYLANLGITHVYASPYLRAVAGSMHGYDVIDHNQINPELGTDKDFAEFLQALQRHGMSHILDTVPNHSGIDTNENAMWNDVLEHGRSSQYAEFFDIAWHGFPRPDLQDRILLPFLGEPYQKVLEAGQIKVLFEPETGRFTIGYFDRRFPISPATYDSIRSVGIETINGVPGQARSFDRLDELLSRQNYRLAWWRVAPDEINYRRFFEINTLVALAMEKPEVFQTTHALTLKLAAEGKVTGLRIDHPDGLYDPQEYFLRLQQAFLLECAHQLWMSDQSADRPAWEEIDVALLAKIREMDFSARASLPLYVLAEKILDLDEELPASWACHGTSGYDFLNYVNGVFVDSSNETKFTEIYQQITGDPLSFDDLAYSRKLLVLDLSFRSELGMLTRRLEKLAREDRRGRDFTYSAMHEALRQIIACFGVYRTYITARGVSETDREEMEKATKLAIARNPRIAPDLFEFARDRVLQESPSDSDAKHRAEQLQFAGKFQQLTAPTMAKGVEDTAFYLYQRFISLNEVGGNPGRFGIGPADLHRYLSERQKHLPLAMSALSTHDTKRSEDVRARLNILSELPDQWKECIGRWMQVNAKHRTDVDGSPAPAPDEEYLIYQTVVGAWPLDPCPAEEFAAFIKRVCEYLKKAMREAKLRTNWTDPNEAREKAIADFIQGILDKEKSPEFFANIRPFVRRVSSLGLINSLSQTLLRLAAPGIPDTYQGMELWDFSLVDPDNRRLVDYAIRQTFLQEVVGIDAIPEGDRHSHARSMLVSLSDGKAKLWLTRQLLTLRRDQSKLFTEGEYLPIEAIGSKAAHVFAFARRLQRGCAIAVAPRLPATLWGNGNHSLPIGPEIWGKTSILVPDAFEGQFFRNILTGEKLTLDVQNGAAELRLADILAHFPVALLLCE